MLNSKKIIVLFIFLPFKLLSQDITGLWQGSLYNDTTKQYYRYEIGISQDKKGKLSGFSHTWFLLEDMQFYGVKKLKIRKAGDGKIIIEDDGLIANNYPVSPAKHVRQLNVLSFSTNDSVMMLSGPFSTNRTKLYNSLTGNVEVKRKNNFRQSALIPHLQELGLDNQLSFVKVENDLLVVESQKKITEQEKKDAKAVIALAIEKDKVASEKMARVYNPTKVTDSKTIISTGNNLAKEIKKEESIAKVIPPVNIKPSEPVVTAATLKAEKQRTADSMLAVNKLKKDADQQNLAFAAENTRKQNIEKQRISDSVLQVKKQEADKKTLADAIANEKKRQADVTAKSSLPSSESASVALKQNTTLPKTNAALEVEKRITVLQQTVTFKTDSLQLALYDNGEVDGDTVSILMNGELIMAHQGLSTNAIRKTIFIDPNADSIQLVMYAENLGSIAPNTGLLVVRDGKDLYEIRFSGDLQKNAAIVFRRKTPPTPKGKF